jgi:hypothetical protein
LVTGATPISLALNLENVPIEDFEDFENVPIATLLSFLPDTTNVLIILEKYYFDL